MKTDDPARPWGMGAFGAMTTRGEPSRFEAAKSIAYEAGGLAMDYFQSRHALNVESKGVQDNVTEADRAVEALIQERLHERFPDDGFLGEESAESRRDHGQECVWVVDPIDGTDCFINGIPVWSISIALVLGGQVEIGVVYDPNARELFASRRGHGSMLNDAPIRVSGATSVQAGIVGVGYSHRVPPEPTLEVLRRLLTAGGMYQRNGSGALMLAYVAAGRLIGYYEAHINAWDALGGLGLVLEAGGWANDFLAGDGLSQGCEILACPPQLAAPLRSICQLAP